jgi:hypothetical protein
VEVYLLELSSQLNGLQAEFAVSDMDWHEHLRSVSRLVLAIDGSRQVPVASKALIAGLGLASAKMGTMAIGQVRELVLRVAGRSLLSDGMTMAGRKIIRGAGWWVALGLTAWDLADHHRTVQQNLPVLRRSLNGYIDELEQQMLHHPETGILQILDGVQRDVLRELEETDQ